MLRSASPQTKLLMFQLNSTTTNIMDATIKICAASYKNGRSPYIVIKPSAMGGKVEFEQRILTGANTEAEKQLASEIAFITDEKKHSPHTPKDAKDIKKSPSCLPSIASPREVNVKSLKDNLKLKYANAEIRKGKQPPLQLRDGKYAFVVIQNSINKQLELRVGNTNHALLALGQPVFAAGDITFEEGVIKKINDQSGGYNCLNAILRNDVRKSIFKSIVPPNQIQLELIRASFLKTLKQVNIPLSTEIELCDGCYADNTTYEKLTGTLAEMSQNLAQLSPAKRQVVQSPTRLSATHLSPKFGVFSLPASANQVSNTQELKTKVSVVNRIVPDQTANLTGRKENGALKISVPKIKIPVQKIKNSLSDNSLHPKKPFKHKFAQFKPVSGKKSEENLKEKSAFSLKPN